MPTVYICASCKSENITDPKTVKLDLLCCENCNYKILFKKKSDTQPRRLLGI